MESLTVQSAVRVIRQRAEMTLRWTLTPRKKSSRLPQSIRVTFLAFNLISDASHSPVIAHDHIGIKFAPFSSPTLTDFIFPSEALRDEISFSASNCYLIFFRDLSFCSFKLLFLFHVFSWVNIILRWRRGGKNSDESSYLIFPFVCADIDGEEIYFDERARAEGWKLELQHLLWEILSGLRGGIFKKITAVDTPVPKSAPYEKQSCELARILQFSRRFAVYVQQHRGGAEKYKKKTLKRGFALLCGGTCDSSHFPKQALLMACQVGCSPPRSPSKF